MRRFRLVSAIVVLALAGMSLPGSAADSERKVPVDLVVTEAMIPYLYQYAACVFGGPGTNAEERITGCEERKTKVQADAVEPMVIWNRGKGPTRNRQFARALDLLDTEARILEKHYGPVPETIIGYMHCMGWNVAQSDQFVRGQSIEYILYDGACREWAKLSVEKSSGLERSLFQRVRRGGRIIRPVQVPMVAYQLNNGLLAGAYR